ncbi:MAG: MBL fold metallo-hydrolase [Bacteroidia bacterium]
MVQNEQISLHFFASGYCEADANVVNPISGKGKAQFYAVWALLFIPKIGYVLFDTGYNEAFQQATEPFPDRFYRWVTPIFVKEKETAKAILAQKGISTEEIKYIIISHFHADHISALNDFPDAKFLCSQESLAQVLAVRGFKAVSSGILQGLIPADFEKRVNSIEQMADKTTTTKEGIKEYYLFQNEQFRLIYLPGHARGMLGFIYETGDKKILYGTDAAWSYETYSKGILPRKIVKLFFDSWTDFVETQEKIRTFEKNNPDFQVLFTHCPKTLQFLSHEA